MGFAKKTDLTKGFGTSQIDYTRNNLQDLLTAANQAVQNHLVKKEKMMLNGIETVVGKAGNFTSEEQYQDAFKTLDSLSSTVKFKDPTTVSMLDNFEELLSGHHENFTADNALNDMFLDVKKNLTGLNEEQSSTQLPAILASVEELIKQYRPNASANVNQTANRLHQDILDAIYVADLLMRKDKKHDDPRWNMEGEGYNTGASLYLAGDFTGAKRAITRGGKQEHNAAWKAAGGKYDDGLERLVYSQKVYKNSRDAVLKKAGKDTFTSKDNWENIDNNGIFRHVHYLPKVSSQSLNMYNIDDAEASVYGLLHAVMNEQTMNQGKGFKNSDSDFHKQLYEYFNPVEGKVDGEGNIVIGGAKSMMDLIKSSMINPEMGGDYNPEDIEWIAREDIVNFLTNNIQFVPDKIGFGDFGFPGWDEPEPGINKLGAEYFLDIIQLNLDMYQSKNNIDNLDVINLGEQYFGSGGQ